MPKDGIPFFQNQIDKNEQTNYNHINPLGRLVINKKGDHENARETFGKGEHAHVCRCACFATRVFAMFSRNRLMG